MEGIDFYRRLMGGNAYTLETVAFNMAAATVLALFIFFIYRKSFSGVLYSLSFNASLVTIAMTTAMVIMLIGSNLAVSLGMVGALSIVRFRSAVKEPRDLAFLFWAIAVGLSAGTGAFLIAGMGSLFIGVMLLLFGRAEYRDNCYLLVLRGIGTEQAAAEAVLSQYGVKHRLRLHSVNAGSGELTYEVFLKGRSGQEIVEHFQTCPGIEEVNLVSFHGEITG